VDGGASERSRNRAGDQGEGEHCLASKQWHTATEQDHSYHLTINCQAVLVEAAPLAVRVVTAYETEF
jgi:hypothetical protein